MSLIKRANIKQTGEIILEKKPVKITKDIKLDFFEPREEITDDQPYIEKDIPDEVKLSEAEKQAQEIINKAVNEAAAIKEKARNEGKSKGEKEASGKIKEALETLNDAINGRKKIIKDAETEILRLAIRAAEQVIRSEVSLHRDVCLSIVSDAINRVSDREQVIIRVNREDADYIKRYKDRLSGIVDGVKSLSILEDSQIEPGGCIIETNLGYVDARISTKIEVLGEALKRASEEVEAV